MNFEQFVERVKDSIKDYLSAEYQDAAVNVYNLEKINNSYVAMTVSDMNGVFPVVNLDDYFWDYSHGRSFNNCMLAMAETLGMETPAVDLQAISNYENAKNHLFIRVSNAEENKDFLKNVPHTIVEDMAITYHLKISVDVVGVSSAPITENILNSYGISKEQLHQDAINNSEKMFAANIVSLNEMMKESMALDMRQSGMPEEQIEGMLNEIPLDNPMTVVTNDVKVNGAAVIFYPEVMDQLAEKIGGDYFILPSSVHETLILPDNGEFTAEQLKAMVTEINATEVSPEDRLTDEVYHYDPIDKVFEKATAFEERQEKKMAHDKAEKKQSVMDRLGEKKEATKQMSGERKTPGKSAELSM